MAPVRSVERALKILFLVARSAEPVGLSEISRATTIDKATALRLLLTLEGFKLIQRDPLTRLYTPGAGLWRLVNSWRNDMRKAAIPYLEALRRTTEETVQLVCPRGLERAVVEALPGPHELVVVPSVGVAVPIYVGASGKTIMAYLPEEERERIIEITHLKPLNPMGVADPVAYRKILEEIRCKGYATSVGDVTIGACAVAAPVFDSTGRIVAAVSLRAPEIRMPPDRMVQLAPLIVQAARNISMELGADMPTAQAS